MNCSKFKERKFSLNDYKRITHTTYECKYHIVFIPKCRKKSLYLGLRQYLGEIFHDLSKQRDCEIIEGHLCVDHVHILVSIPPKYSVSQFVGFLKGKSAICIARNFLGKRKNFTGQSFWARGYFVSTVGSDEATIKEYIQKQEVEDKRVEQLEIFREI